MRGKDAIDNLECWLVLTKRNTTMDVKGEIYFLLNNIYTHALTGFEVTVSQYPIWYYYAVTKNEEIYFEMEEIRRYNGMLEDGAWEWNRWIELCEWIWNECDYGKNILKNTKSLEINLFIFTYFWIESTKLKNKILK